MQKSDGVGVMILAAGRGERLRPLTDTLPKPLMEVAGMTLLDRHLHTLAECGVNEVIINVSHLAQQIIRHTGDGSRHGIRIRYSPEPGAPLETAGGIVNALPLLPQPRLIVINADIVTDFSFETLWRRHPQGAHLVMVPNPPRVRGDFRLEQDRLRSLDQKTATGEAGLTFSGIAIYNRLVFENLSSGYQALRPVFDDLVLQDGLTGEKFDGQWFDIGDLERLERARLRFRQP